MLVTDHNFNKLYVCIYVSYVFAKDVMLLMKYWNFSWFLKKYYCMDFLSIIFSLGSEIWRNTFHKLKYLLLLELNLGNGMAGSEVKFATLFSKPKKNIRSLTIKGISDAVYTWDFSWSQNLIVGSAGCRALKLFPEAKLGRCKCWGI